MLCKCFSIPKSRNLGSIIENSALDVHGLNGSVATYGFWRIMVRVQIAAATLSDNSHRRTVHTHCASVRQAAKLVAALLRVARVTAGLAESNGSLPPG